MKEAHLTLPMPKRYRFRFRTLDAVYLSPYAGSAWRGLIGHGLKSVACVTGLRQCDPCPLAQQCVHARFFEALPAAKGTQRLHPFSLQVASAPRASALKSGETFGFGITLLGEGVQALPYLIEAVKRAGRLGMGREHGRFELASVQAESFPGSGKWHPCWPETEAGAVNDAVEELAQPSIKAINIHFHTPLRLKYRGHLAGAEVMDAQLFLTALRRRLSGVTGFHIDNTTSITLALPEENLDAISMACNSLHWHEWRRYSSRQRTAMQMGGLVGQMQLEGEGLSAWWPALWYGQWVHLGKATSMGLGRYSLDTASLPQPATSPDSDTMVTGGVAPGRARDVNGTGPATT